MGELWIQRLHLPRIADPRVQKPIVQPARTAVPELDPRRPDAIAAPERRAGHGLPVEPRFDVADSRFEGLARIEHVTLQGRPRPDLAPARPAGEVLVRFLRGQPLDAPFDANLLVERRPVKRERRVRVDGQLAALPAVVVRVEDEAALV